MKSAIATVIALLFIYGIFQVSAISQCHLCYGPCEEETVIDCSAYFPVDITSCLTMKIDDYGFVNKGCIINEDAAILCNFHNQKYGEGSCVTCDDADLCN